MDHSITFSDGPGSSLAILPSNGWVVPTITQAQPAPPRQSTVTLSEAIEAVMRVKQDSNLRPLYVRGLNLYLTAFERRFGADTPIASITTEDIELWFQERGEKSATRLSNAGRLGAMFSFAWRRKWIKENPVRFLEKPRVERRSPRILTPEEAKHLLETVRVRWPRFLPAVTLMLLCGVRPTEVSRLRWDALNIDEKRLTIDAAASKVRSRRYVTLRPAAEAWLLLSFKHGGELPCKSHRRFMRRLGRVNGWWQADVLRHTFISYALSSEGDVGKLATEAGNSVGILQRHYLCMTAKSASEKFWNILPN